MGITTLDFFRLDRSKGFNSQGIFVQSERLYHLVRLDIHNGFQTGIIGAAEFRRLFKHLGLLRSNITLMLKLLEREEQKTALLAKSDVKTKLVKFERDLKAALKLMAKYLTKVDMRLANWQIAGRPPLKTGTRVLSESLTQMDAMMKAWHSRGQKFRAFAPLLIKATREATNPPSVVKKSIFGIFRPRKLGVDPWRDSGGVFTSFARRARWLHSHIAVMERDSAHFVMHPRDGRRGPDAAKLHDKYFDDFDKHYKSMCRLLGIGSIIMPWSLTKLIKKEMRLTKRWRDCPEKEHVEKLEQELAEAIQILVRSVRDIDGFRKNWRRAGFMLPSRVKDLQRIMHQINRVVTKMEARAQEVRQEVVAIRRRAKMPVPPGTRRTAPRMRPGARPSPAAEALMSKIRNERRAA